MTTWTFQLDAGGAGQDIAELSLHHGGTSFEPPDDQLNNLAQGGYNAWADNMTPTRFAAAVTLAGVKTYRYDAAGHVIGIGSYQDPAPWHGTSTSPCLPWETSLALSLYTYPRGSFVPNPRRRRGRIYLPPMSSAQLELANSGYYSDSDLPNLFEELHDFVQNSGDDALGVALAPLVVFSRVAEALYPVTDLYIDARFDSQRRRENAQVAGKLHIEL